MLALQCHQYNVLRQTLMHDTIVEFRRLVYSYILNDTLERQLSTLLQNAQNKLLRKKMKDLHSNRLTPIAPMPPEEPWPTLFKLRM